ncbi:MAG: hypothetical protein NVSMB56_20510 [Pyrinomonadaceae bacterium]
MELINLSSDTENTPPRFSVKLIALVSALFVSGCLLIVYAVLRERHQREFEVKAKAQAALKAMPVPTPTPAAQIFQDESFLRGAQAVVGGRVRNISDHQLENLAVVLELTSRDGKRKEQRTVPLKPADLAPTEEGHYMFNVTSRDWSNAHLVGLRSANTDEIAFKGELGTIRPLDQPNAKQPGGVQKPRSTTREGDIINTPDTAIVVH